jgi:nitrogen-specific signal transduction histidine kinase/CheY-like chemotaxis protein
MNDVTEQRHLEEQLRQAHKMEAIGRLAAGVAHDFNNMLTVIGGYTSMQLGRSKLQADTEKAFGRIKLAAERGSLLTKSLLTFSRKQPVKRVSLDVAEAVTGLRNLLTGMVGETIQLEVICEAKTRRVCADPSSVHQIVMNLVLNAREAMPDGGSMTVQVTSSQVSPEEALVSPDRRPGEFLVLSVTDAGCGMDRETMARIFEPFFTTKPFGHGAGLGLATVYGLVEQHDGWVEVASEPGRGSRFRVFLPFETREEAEAPERGTSRYQKPANGRAESVMVVEDEPEVRELLVSLLRHQGYRVEQASSGAEALHTWNRFGTEFDLLLTDMVMPGGVSGSKLARSLLRQKPDLKVIYTSGYSRDAIANEHALQEGANFLAKPFSPDRLYQTVRAALDDDGRAVPLAPA